MSANDSRDEIWASVAGPWDVLVIGGGITGAGILREAVRAGLRVLLVEQRDFAWGTSSRSSKLVHGGLRYLKEGRLWLTRASVHERQQLLSEGPGLIDPLGFLLTIYHGDFPGRWTFGMGLTVYDLLALRWDHRYYSPEDFQMLAPHIARRNLRGGFRYGDAQTDDARLVFRVIQEAGLEGGVALNYARAEGLIRTTDPLGKPQVVGIRLHDQIGDRTAEVRARVVINATGAWADHLRGECQLPPRIRPLRGSHLIFPSWRLPVAQAVSFLHPVDRRPVFIFPWEGITLVGTTDFDHDGLLDEEPAISPEEVAYLMAAVESQFPSLLIGLEDVLSTFAGVRPVISSGKADPSQESRDHVVWEEDGLLTVTGGKLTTFRVIAQDALKAVAGWLPEARPIDRSRPVLNRIDLSELSETLRKIPGGEALDATAIRRLAGRYGARAGELARYAQPGELAPVAGTPYLWAELRWAAGYEHVSHLDDLLLRRVRLGLLLPEGGKEILPRVRQICQEELGWDELHWKQEEAAFLHLWRTRYSLPERELIPDWTAMLAEANALRLSQQSIRRGKIIKGSALVGGLLGAAFLSAFLLWRWYRCRQKSKNRLAATPRSR